MWKLRVVSTRLLMLVIVTILLIILITMITQFMEPHLHYAGQESRHLGHPRRHVIEPPVSPPPDTAQGSGVISLDPVKIPGAQVWIMSAIFRQDPDASAHQGRIMLQGWKDHDDRFDQFVCCLRKSDWASTKESIQVDATVPLSNHQVPSARPSLHPVPIPPPSIHPAPSAPFSTHRVPMAPASIHPVPIDLSSIHFAPMQSPIIQSPYVDVQYWCSVGKNFSTFNPRTYTVSISLTSCLIGRSQDLTVHLPDIPDTPFGRHLGNTNFSLNPSVDRSTHANKTTLFYSLANQPAENGALRISHMSAKESEGGDHETQLDIIESRQVINYHQDHRPTLRQSNTLTFDRGKLSPKIRLGACAGVMDFGSVSRVEQVVEWFEHLRLLAVERVQLFHYNASDQVLAVLEFYQMQRFLNAVPWKFATSSPEDNAYGIRGKHSWVEENLAYNDCLQRLSDYTVIVFTSLYQLIVTKQRYVNLINATQEALQLNPKAGLLTLHTHLVPPCPPQEPNTGEGLALIPHLKCNASHGSDSMTWLLLPGRADHMLQRHVFLYEGFDRLKLPTTMMEAVAHINLQETEIADAVGNPDVQALVRLRSRVLQRTRCLSSTLKSTSSSAEIVAMMQRCFGQMIV